MVGKLRFHVTLLNYPAHESREDHVNLEATNSARWIMKAFVFDRFVSHRLGFSHERRIFLHNRILNINEE